MLIMNGISKKFPGVIALDSVDFEISKGEVRAIVGKNGAGKSTLIKILTGIYKPDKGNIIIDGKSFSHIIPDIIYREGIHAIYQEVDLVPYFTVGETVMLNNNNQDGSKKKFFIERKNMNEIAHEILLKKIGVDINPQRLMKDLSTAEAQLVQIARALVREPKILILDEPTAPLSAKEIDQLFKIIKDMKSSGITIIYISHRLKEIFDIADSVTVLRDGKKVADLALNETNENEIISFMTGKAMEEVKKSLEEKSVFNKVSLEVENLETEKVHKISFNLYKGEILGLFGAEGAGQEEIARSIFGLLPKRGRIKMEGEKIQIHNVKEAIKKGIGCLLREPTENLIMTFSVAENITLPYIDNFSLLGLVKKSLEENIAKQKIKEFAIKARGPNTILSTLSGGNRRKVAFAKWSNFPLKVLILDYPTMGIDVQAKSEIYRILKNIASQGTAILLITPEYEEIKMLCDRVLVIQDGHLKANLKFEEIDENILLKYAIGSSLIESGVV